MVCAMESLYALGALDDEGLLTRLGRKMAEFPLEPNLSKILITSVDLGCSEEVLTVVSMLSVENPFYRPKDRQSQADQKKAKFLQAEGDHLTLLAVYDAWVKAKMSNPWCYENFIQARAMKRGADVRKQLVAIMDRYKMDIVSAGRNWTLVRKAVVAGYFTNAAKKDPQEGYKTMVEGTPVCVTAPLLRFDYCACFRRCSDPARCYSRACCVFPATTTTTSTITPQTHSPPPSGTFTPRAPSSKRTPSGCCTTSWS